MSVRSTARKFIKIRKVVGKAHDGASRKPEKHQEKEEQSWHGRNDAMVEQIQLVAKACYFSRKRVGDPASYGLYRFFFRAAYPADCKREREERQNMKRERFF